MSVKKFVFNYMNQFLKSITNVVVKKQVIKNIPHHAWIKLFYIELKKIILVWDPDTC